MKLLFQSDDYGFTDAITDGILKGIKEGIIRNTGLFVNMPSSKRAAELIKNIEGISVGIDINFVAGYPVTKDPIMLTTLIREDGHFISSVEQMKKLSKPIDQKNILQMFDEDPYDYEEVLNETEAQVLKFIELMGRKPAYIHPHSLVTKNTANALMKIAEKYDIVFSGKAMRNDKIHMVPCDWTPKPFSIEKQFETNVEDNLYNALTNCLNHEYAYFICHCGYVDSDLLSESTYTIIRCKDLAAATSDKIKNFIRDNEIELINYNKIKEILG
ncbi:ChbG/HpnK family deacetylase [Anaerorhabdus sp.]|uniref:ChbG/HpnK family deacetylase n=2 Tax=Anaerorhabdus sp. TaxID=1872524 RepID=UPI002FC9819F